MTTFGIDVADTTWAGQYEALASEIGHILSPGAHSGSVVSKRSREELLK